MIRCSSLFVSIILLANVVGTASGQMQREYPGTVLSLLVPADVTDEDASALHLFLEGSFIFLRDSLRLPSVELTAKILPVTRFESEAGTEWLWRPVILRPKELLLRVARTPRDWHILKQYAKFQMAMAFLEPAIARGCPQWYAEAFAVYFADLPEDRKPPLKGTMTAFEDLSQDLQRFPQPPGRVDVECVLSLTMEFFITTFGRTKSLEILSAFDGVSHPDAVFKKILGAPMSQIEEQWAAFLRGQTPRVGKTDKRRP